MATNTSRKPPPKGVERLQARAKHQGHFMEQEARTLTCRFAAREAVLDEVQALWSRFEPPTAAEVTAWMQAARMGAR